ncbi:NACHT, LRR and PYD domains-containing protein 1 homolog [Puntigrus tetrazona]|uniref:NACHT, LRR and PYD domains-containing protein 1 homolog n=1 Tax=Puntigrus tetrazona TaxID=1606681 RepID=UPI001C8A8B7B|nr:NACHT, LRR and PYD domains-containing protein 1 homolog [Puntigrus tetrazona]
MCAFDYLFCNTHHSLINKETYNPGSVQHVSRKLRSRDPEWQEMVYYYKKSVDWKDQNERSFPSGERGSLAALYTEPEIQRGYHNISIERLFGYLPESFILHGNSGSGKSIIAQKVMLDWASEKPYLKNFDLAFSLRYDELKCISEEMNLIELLSLNCSLTSDQISMMLENSESALQQRVLFIIDGLDDFNYISEFELMRYELCISSIFQKAPPEVVVCSLLLKSILPSSLFLITTKTKVPQGLFFTVNYYYIRVLGFSENRVEEYFQKFFQNKDLFRRAYECVRSNKSLFKVCSIPVICWIICTLLRERLSDGVDVTSGLETTTSVYTDFVSTLLERHCQGQSIPSLVRSLGQLAERGMLEQQVLFDEKSVHETISDPAGSPFLCERRIGQETMFSFLHHSFQEFFTALYYVLLDEDESKRKVSKLLHTVERGWALSRMSGRETDLETGRSSLLQPVILFLCGLCTKEGISSFFKKHNMAVSGNIETQLKEWINQCSRRYQNKHMLFILHCLCELHEKSFVGNVLERLDYIDLSNILLKDEDCWTLRFCFENCANIGKLRLNIKSDNLKILQSALCRYEEIWLQVDHITDDTRDLISAFGEGKIVKELIIQERETSRARLKEAIKSLIITSVNDEDVTVSSSKSSFSLLISELTRQDISTVNWTSFLQKLRLTSSQVSRRINTFLLDESVSGLKKVDLQITKFTDTWTDTILSLLRGLPSLNELKINSAVSFIPDKMRQILEKSLNPTGWTLTFWRKTVLIERNRKSFTEEEMETFTERAEPPSGQSCSGDAEVFTPECVQQDDKDNHKTIYRFLCPHAGQFSCSLTSLVFVMGSEGEVRYRLVSWDPRQLVGFDQMKPAGPLYSIDCSSGSISRLHLPHCEIFSEENKDSLAVAHFTGGNVEIMKPLQVNETHAMIDIGDLSLFGLLKRMLFPPSPVAAQLLFFLRPVTARQRENILDVHLLPLNVPLSEVKDQHKENTFIKTSSKSSLTPGSQYSLCCETKGSTVQPETEIFDCNFGPNFHPTFEVFVDVNTEEVSLSLSDETEGKEVWLPRRILLAGKDSDPLLTKGTKKVNF